MAELTQLPQSQRLEKLTGFLAQRFQNGLKSPWGVGLYTTLAAHGWGFGLTEEGSLLSAERP